MCEFLNLWYFMDQAISRPLKSPNPDKAKYRNHFNSSIYRPIIARLSQFGFNIEGDLRLEMRNDGLYSG